ncbi:MAG: beta-galactosidase [Pseudarcicella sp.]|nr:beta-galactosidase [Pseudarcicella sp.]
MNKLTLAMILGFGVNVFSQTPSWKIAEVPIKTPWAEKVDINNTLGEYPRPIMVRKDWKNLNGLWEFQEAQLSDIVPFNKTLKGKILVPFAWESALSGIRKQLDSKRAWYRRTFEVPVGWEGKQLILNFGAVDWESTVYINGRCAGTHKGGYDAFSFDVTPFLKSKGLQEIVILVYDPTNSEHIAYGKQDADRFNNPQRYAYAPCSGIWQTVWIEPVAEKSIANFHIVPDIDASEISLSINPSTKANKKDSTLSLSVEVFEGNKLVASQKSNFIEINHIKIPNQKLWSPKNPFLYDIKIKLLRNETEVVDEVTGYFGMRKVSLKKEKGLQRLALNNEFLYQFGPLDQGYWPDGIYTAPTDEALKWDVEQIKDWGFNMVRKHIKVEPQRWYYWCDKIGLLVWQDMPSTFGDRTEEEKAQFEGELVNMVKQKWNHPSIVNWVVFNEHWGIYDVERLTNFTMALDPSRLVIGNSGIDAGKPDVDFEVGHIKDNHSYRPPSTALASDKRAVVNGEYGAIGYLLPNNQWDADGPWVHYNYKGMEDATKEYERFIEMITSKFQKEGSSAAVYTQWTDVENEMNGLYSYDRKIIKLDKNRVKKANESTWKVDRLFGKKIVDVNE